MEIGDRIYTLTTSQIKELAKEIASEMKDGEALLSRIDVRSLLSNNGKPMSNKYLQKVMKDPENPLPHYGSGQSAKFIRSEVLEWVRTK